MWKSSWAVAQVSLPLPRNLSSRFRGLFGGQGISRLRTEQRADTSLPVCGTKVPEVEMDNGDLMKITFAVMGRDVSTGGSQSDVR